MSYKVTYNGVSSEDVGVIMYDLPGIALAKRNYNTYSIPGRDGELIGSDTYLSNAKVSCTFSVLSDNFMEVIRNIRKWLKGTGKLYLSDNFELFYEVLAIDYGNIERELSRYGQFSVNFTCYPYEFADSGQQEYSVQDVSRNPYDACMPLYKIHGNGECALKVNNHDFVANISKVLNIDSRLMICYDADKNYKNTSVLGDYEKLWLKNGQNMITITNGFSLMVEPRWGYSL